MAYLFAVAALRSNRLQRRNRLDVSMTSYCNCIHDIIKFSKGLNTHWHQPFEDIPSLMGRLSEKSNINLDSDRRVRYETHLVKVSKCRSLNCKPSSYP